MKLNTKTERLLKFLLFKVKTATAGLITRIERILWMKQGKAD